MASAVSGIFSYGAPIFSQLTCCSKTQITLAYVYWLREMHPDVSVFWVHASNHERFHKAYTSIAEECSIPGYDDPEVDVLSLVQTFLETKYKNRWTMVIDNADDTQLFFRTTQEGNDASSSDSMMRSEGSLGRYIPECSHGSILMTTRNKQTGSRFARGKSTIKVGEMTDTEAHQMVCAILEVDNISLEETSLLSSRLENLPLALAQAVAFIVENSISISEYVRLLDKSDSSLVDRLSEPFEAIGRDSDTPHALTATWIISFEQIERRNLFASEVLSLISLFDRQAIPKDFVAEYYYRMLPEDAEGNEADITKAIGALEAFSFISKGKDQNFDMHRLVQLVTRKWLANTERLAEFARHALETMSVEYPEEKFETWGLCLTYLPHALAVLDNSDKQPGCECIPKAALLGRLGGYFFDMGRHNDAEQYYVKAIQLQVRELGEENPSTLASMNNLASTYRYQGRWKEAEELEIQVLEARKRVLGEDHPSTLTSMNKLASTYRYQGRWKEAEELEIQVLEARKRVLGEDHPSTLASMNNLASTYRYQGRWKEAEELEIQVLEARKRVLGEDHPSTLISMNNLAYTWKDQGRSGDAIELMRECIRLRQQRLGSDHRHTIESLETLARWEEEEWDDSEDENVQGGDFAGDGS
ncbi:hypothetical protein AUP68_03980 [Ilyonectria robusta]